MQKSIKKVTDRMLVPHLVVKLLLAILKNCMYKSLPVIIF